MLKKLFIFNLILLTASFSFNFAQSIEPDIFVQSTVNRASDTLSGNNTKEERIQELKKMARVPSMQIAFFRSKTAAQYPAS